VSTAIRADHADHTTSAGFFTRHAACCVSDSWCGCTNGEQMRPRAKEWDADFGEPLAVCKETKPGSGIYEREWTKASVEWDCASAHGKITAK
jgi:hypothetical protein